MSLDLKKLVRSVNDSNKIISPKLTEWLLVYGDKELDAAIADRIRELLVTPPRVRSGSFASSSAGKCYRAQELNYLGVPGRASIDPQLQNIFWDGKWRHLRWQAMLLMAGILQDVEWPLTWERMRSRGTMDGVGVVWEDHPRNHWRGEEFGFELKGISPYQFQTVKNYGAKEEHLDQVHRYFLSGGMKLFVIIYENKGTNEWHETVIEADPARLSAQKEELQLLNKAIDQKRLHDPLPDCRMRKGPVWQECPWAGVEGPCEQAELWPSRR